MFIVKRKNNRKYDINSIDYSVEGLSVATQQTFLTSF